MKSKEYWNNSFDERYKKLHEDVINKKRLPLKVSPEKPSYSTTVILYILHFKENTI